MTTTTQGTCHHCYEVNTSPSREISNRHFILLCVRRWIETHDVNLSIPWWRNFCSWQNNLQSHPTSHLFVYYVENFIFVIHQIALLLQVFGQVVGSTCRLRSDVLSLIKKVWGAHFHASHKINHASSNVVISNWIKLVPTYIGHVGGTSGLSTQYFFLVLPTQWVKSYAQNQNLWQINADPFKSDCKAS